MKPNVALLALLAGALCFCASRASPVPLPPDSRQEVAAALFAAAETQAVLQKVADADLRAAQARIAELQRKVAQGDAKLRVALAAAQQQFVAALSAKDHAYAEAIAAFRGTVTDIASTPEGAAALARFNAGDEAGALAILDRLEAAHEAALQARLNVEKAAGRRRIADLARDARDRGKIPAENVIARYEDVVALDPGVAWDWIQLERLYLDVGRYDDALRVIGRAVDTAATERDRFIALSDRGNVESDLGRLEDARRDYLAASASAETMLKADPENRLAQRDLVVNTSALGMVLMAQEKYAEARASYERALVISRKILAADPGNGLLQGDVAGVLSQLGDALKAQGDTAGARAAYVEVVAIDRNRVTADPEGVRAQTDLAIDLGRFATLVDGADAIKALKESLDILRRMKTLDPHSVEVRRNLGTVMWNLAEQKGSGMTWAEVVVYFEDLKSSGIIQPRDRGDLDKALSMARDSAAREAKP